MKENKNTFKDYQDKKMTERLIIINQCIDFYKKNKVTFKNITEISGEIAASISKKECKPCSKSTILRNIKYKSLIEDFFYKQSGVSKPSIANNLLKDLTISNIEKENIRLKQYILNLEKRLQENNVNVTENTVDKYISNSEKDKIKWKENFFKLVNHFEGLVIFNDNGDLIDLTKKINNIIVIKNKLGNNNEE